MKKRNVPLVYSLLTLGLNIAGWFAFALCYIEVLDLSFEVCVIILIVNAILVISSMIDAFVYKEFSEDEEDAGDYEYYGEYGGDRYTEEWAKPESEPESVKDESDYTVVKEEKPKKIVEGLKTSKEFEKRRDNTVKRKEDKPEAVVEVFYHREEFKDNRMCSCCGVANNSELSRCRVCGNSFI